MRKYPFGEQDVIRPVVETENVVGSFRSQVISPLLFVRVQDEVSASPLWLLYHI